LSRARSTLAPRRTVTPSGTREVLENGAVLTSLRMPRARHVAIAVAVRVGSRHEPAQLGGVSHFLEHMLFRGTREHPSAHAQNFAFESLGGTLDAATSAETTIFSTAVPPKAAAEAIVLIGEMFRDPVMAQLELERNVVREEILDSLDEDDQLVDADELTARALFGDHPLGQSIGGTVASLSAIREEDLRRWHRTHYVGENLVIAVAGAITREVLDACRETLGAIPRGARTPTAPVRAAKSATRATLVETTGSQVDLRVSFLAPGVRDRGWPAITMLSRILDDGMSARVFRTMIEDRGLAYEAFGDVDPYSDVSAFSLGAACRPENAPEATRTLLELATKASEGITDRELARVRTRTLFEIDLAHDSPEAHVDLMLGNELDGQSSSLDELAERARAIRIPHLVAAAKKVFRPDTLAIVAVGPLGTKTKKKLEEIARRA
jgi:predicted Zn-dependent peptidase